MRVLIAAAPPRRTPLRRRRRTTPHPEPPAIEKPSEPEITEIVTAQPESGSGSFGRGTFDDDDDDGRRRDRGPDDDGRRPLLVALALLVLGATVMSARMLARPRSRTRG